MSPVKILVIAITSAFLGCGVSPDAGSDPDAADLPPDGPPALDAATDAPSAECPTQTHHACGAACVAHGPNVPATGCALGCGDPCPTVANGTAICSAEGRCDVACDAGFAAVGGECSPAVCDAMGYVCGTFVDDAGNAFECGRCDGSSIIYVCRPDHTCDIPLDADEPNDTAATATVLGPYTDGGFDVRWYERRAHAASDEDWYRFQVIDATNFKLEPILEVLLEPDHPDGTGQYELTIWARCDHGDDGLEVGCGSVFSGGTPVNDPVHGMGCVHHSRYQVGASVTSACLTSDDSFSVVMRVRPLEGVIGEYYNLQLTIL